MAHTKYYNSKNEKIPSVTQILSVINCPSLFYWGVKMAKNGECPIAYTKWTAETGTLLHSIIQFSIDGTKIEWDKYKKEQIKIACHCAKRFFEWKSYQCEFIPIHSELKLSNELFGGTIDAIARLNSKLSLIDFKSCNEIRDTAVAQVSAYKRLAEDQGYKIEQVIILRFGREESEGYEYREISKKELKYGLKMFDCALKLYKSKKEFEKVLKESEVK